MAYITKRKPSPVGDKPKEDKIEKPTNKWIQKKEKPTEWIKKKKRFKGLQPKAKGTPQNNPLKELVAPFKEESKYIQKKKPLKAGGRAKHNIGGRANLLEEMGRIDARRHPDAADRAEKRRVIGELNRGYNAGGKVVKTIVSPGTHKRNIASAKIFKLMKGKPKLAKKGWK